MERERHPIGGQRVELESPDRAFSLTLFGNDRNYNLEIVEPKNFAQGSPRQAQDFIRTLLLAHLIAPTLPENIETNFPVEGSEIITGLYRHYGREAPKIHKAEIQITPKYLETEANSPVIPFASATSGGADSAYRITDLLKRGQSVLGIHIQNLNKAPHAEALASQKQCETWKVPYLRIKLRNSSGNGGYQTMRTRDLLIGGLCAVAAAPFRCQKVLLEGPMGADPQVYQYSEYTEAWRLFIKLLKSSGLEMEVEGVGVDDIETIGELIKIEKETSLPILNLIQNCFSAPFQLTNNRRKWERATPNLSKASPEQWCGSCYKCRRMSLGRFVYKDPAFEKVPEKEKGFFVKDTYDWIQDYPHNQSLLSESFLNHLSLLAKRSKNNLFD